MDRSTSGVALLLASPDLDIVNSRVKIIFPTGSSTAKAGIVFAVVGNANYYLAIINRSTGKIALHQVTAGSLGGVLASASVTIIDDTQYTLSFNREQKQVMPGVGSATFTYDSENGITLPWAMDFGPRRVLSPVIQAAKGTPARLATGVAWVASLPPHSAGREFSCSKKARKTRVIASPHGPGSEQRHLIEPPRQGGLMSLGCRFFGSTARDSVFQSGPRFISACRRRVEYTPAQLS